MRTIILSIVMMVSATGFAADKEYTQPGKRAKAMQSIFDYNKSLVERANELRKDPNIPRSCLVMTATKFFDESGQLMTARMRFNDQSEECRNARGEI